MAGAGNAHHVKALAEEVSLEIGDRIFVERDLREKVAEVLNKTYKKYNADRLKSLGLLDTERRYFEATSLLGAKLYNNTFGLYLLNSDPWIEPISDYETIGSGAPFANLMLQQLNRGLESIGISYHDLPLMFCLLYATYIINEVKTVDIKSGGSTKVGIIDADGYRAIPDNLLAQRYNGFLDLLSTSYGKMLNDPIAKDTIRRIFPPHQ